MARLNKEHLLGIACIVIAAVTYALAAQLPKGQNTVGVNVTGPGLFPNIIATILALSGLAQIVIGYVKSSSTPGITFGKAVRQLKRPEVINVVFIIALLIVFELLFERLGFILSTFAFLLVIMLRLGVRPVRAVGYSVGFVAVIYLLFTMLFSVTLPSGVLTLVGM